MIGGSYFASSPFRREDLGTMGTREPMGGFAMLRVCQWMYLDYFSHNIKRRTLFIALSVVKHLEQTTHSNLWLALWC